LRIDKRYAAGWAIGLVLHLGLAFIGYRATPVSGTTDDLIPIEIVSVAPPEVEEVIEEPEPTPPPPEPEPEPEPVDLTDRPIPTEAEPDAEPEAEPVFGLSDESVVEADDGDLDLDGLAVPIGNTIDIAPGGERPDTVRALEPVPYHLTTTPPQMTSPPVTVYPEILKDAGITGRVVMELIISVDGRVIEAKVAHTTHNLFGEAALRAVKECRFSPGKQNGVAVPVRVHIPLRFELK